MLFSRQEPIEGTGRRSRRRRISIERLEPRSMLAGLVAGEFSRPAGLPAATEPTAYFDVSTGVLQLDPTGQDISLVNFTYNTEVANILGTTPGPFVFPSGTGRQVVSTTSEKKILPAGSWPLVTTFPARLAGATTLTNTPTLATSGENSASTNGWFNKPWNFGTVITPNTLTLESAQLNFIAITSKDIGYGAGRGLFQYSAFGTFSSQYGKVIVVASPDPATQNNAIIGMAGTELIVSRANGSSFATTPLATLPAGETWVNSVGGDFDGDGRRDVAVQTAAGSWWVTTTPASGTATPRAWGAAAAFQFATVGDFNGDGKDDIAARVPSDGSWQVLTSSGTAFTASRFGRWNPTLSWSNVLAGDFNADGRADLVGKRSDGAWVVAASTGTSFSSTIWAFLSIDQFGTVGDFNADGRDDVAVRNAANGSWRVLSSNGTTFALLKFGTWDATATWNNVRAGDFNGDGRTDLVGQRGDGAWIVSSSTGTSFTTAVWGYLAVGQFATVGDFTGDGLEDVAVRNPTNGAWRVLASDRSSFSSAKVGEWPTAKAWSRAFATRT